MAMALDRPALALNTGLSAVCAAIAMVYAWRVHGRDPAVRHWASGFLGVAVGIVAATAMATRGSIRVSQVFA